MAFPTGWNRRATLTIPGSTWFDSGLTDFPVLFTLANLPSEMFDADGSYPANSDGGDIRFSSDSAGTTELATQVVVFTRDNNPANGTAEIWVKVPSTSSSSTTLIYVWYNNSSASMPAANATYGSQNVWDSNFKTVYHLQEAVNNTAAGYKDATSNAADATGTSMSLSPVAALWGSGGLAADFDGTADYIKASGTSPAAGLGALTVSAWVKSDSATQTTMIAEDGSAYDTNGFYIYSNAGKPATEICLPAGLYDQETDTSANISTSTFEHIALIWVSASRVNMCRNGASVSGTLTGGLRTGNLVTGDQPVTLASRPGGTHSLYYDGKIDEFRLSATDRSVAWLKAEYKTGSAPADITAGTPDFVGASGNPYYYYQSA